MMEACLDVSSVAFAAAGLMVLLSALLPAVRWGSAVPIALELWTAAGLLRLLGEPSWSRIAAAGAIVVMRRLIALSRGQPLSLESVP